MRLFPKKVILYPLVFLTALILALMSALLVYLFGIFFLSIISNDFSEAFFGPASFFALLTFIVAMMWGSEKLLQTFDPYLFNEPKRRREIAGIFTAITPLFLIGVVCLFVFLILFFSPTTEEQKVKNMEAVSRMLELAAESPSGQLPQNKEFEYLQKQALISSYLTKDMECWNYLQIAMAENSGQYDISAQDNGVPFRPGVDDSIVEVVFPDNQQAKLFFYQGALVSCAVPRH